MIDTSTDIQIKKNSVKKKIQIKKMIYTYTNKKKIHTVRHWFIYWAESVAGLGKAHGLTKKTHGPFRNLCLDCK